MTFTPVVRGFQNRAIADGRSLNANCRGIFAHGSRVRIVPVRDARERRPRFHNVGLLGEHLAPPPVILGGGMILRTGKGNGADPSLVCQHSDKKSQ
jgi:hypothetical protein